jgi:hypothetical protein
MRRIEYLVGILVVVVSQGFACQTAADIFGSGANAFEIEFVPIRNAGNPPDANPNPAGAVPYDYRIGKYEVSEQMIDKANALGVLGITKDTRGPDKPATSINWYEAAQFVNWLNTSTGCLPAYKFDINGNFQLWQPLDPGYDPENFYRNKLARYFLPSIHEWHKAAYYDPVSDLYYDYPTGSDSIPDGTDFVNDPVFDALFNDGASNPGPNNVTNAGLSSPFGTVGQGGNVTEWEETAFDRLNNSASSGRGVRGGSWGNISTHLLASNRNAIGPAFDANFFGFRIASIIPEPSSIVLLGLGLLGFLGITSRYSIERSCHNALHTSELEFLACQTRVRRRYAS